MKFICPHCQAENVVSEGVAGYCALCGYSPNDNRPRVLSEPAVVGPRTVQDHCEFCNRPFAKCKGHTICG